MKKIHLYSLYDPKEVEDKTGYYINPDKLVWRNHGFPLKKEDFSGTEEYLKDYSGKWHIDVIQQNSNAESSPFKVVVFFIGPHGKWADPAEVYLVLED